MAPGFIEVTIVQAKDIPKVQRVGKQDPYALLKLGAQEFKTRTDEDGGVNPKFNQTFRFNLQDNNTFLTVVLMNDKAMRDDTIGTAREQGTVELVFKAHLPAICPSGPPSVPPPADATAAKMEKMSLDPAQAYNEALAVARAKHFAEVAQAMVPHGAVTGALSAQLLEASKDVLEDELKEMKAVFMEAKDKADKVSSESIKEWAELAEEFLGEIPSTIKQHDPDAEKHFARQLEELAKNMEGAHAARKERLDKSHDELMSSIQGLLLKYKDTIVAVVDEYEAAFQKAMSKYKNDVEEQLKAEAEKKSLAEAGTPPPGVVAAAAGGAADARGSAPPAPAQAPVAAGPPPPVAYASAPPATAPPPAAVHMPPAAAVAGAAVAGAAVGAAVANASYPPPAGAPAPQGYPYPPQPGAAPPAPAGYPPPSAAVAQAEAETRRAQEQAYYAQQQAARAQYEAEMARRQAAQQQAAMQAQIYAQRRRRAVRRTVVGGVMLAKIID